MAGKAWEGTQLLPENRTTNDIVRSSKLDGTGGNGFYIDAVNIALRDIQRTLNQAQALLASSGSAITAGQGYIIDNGGVLQLPTGISLMRVRGINLPSGVKGFDPNAEAYITALATYVPCTYDVGTNDIQGKYIAWAGDLNADLTVATLHINITGQTPTITNSVTGQIDFAFTGGILVSVAAQNTISGVMNLAVGRVFTGFGLDADTFRIEMGIIGVGLADIWIDGTYVEISLNLKSL